VPRASLKSERRNSGACNVRLCDHAAYHSLGVSDREAEEREAEKCEKIESRGHVSYRSMKKCEELEI
jgi:hypothetical protein